jgi:hypothetical protein
MTSLSPERSLVTMNTFVDDVQQEVRLKVFQELCAG